jgi:protein arginine kinase activator
MQCQECGIRPATLHFTKIVNGDKTEYHLCDACAREKGEIIPGTSNGFSIHNLISGLLDLDLNHPGHIQGGEPKQLQCRECGMTYAQFSKMGRFGCSACYRYFSARLDPLLRRIHGNTAHVGKIPRRSGGVLHTRKQLEQLKARLAQAVQNEEFEKAAVLRDEIRRLEKETGKKA